VTQGKVFLLDSISGAVCKVNSPTVLEALEQQADYQQVYKAVVDSRGSKKLKEKYGTTIDGVPCASRPFDMALYAYACTLNTYHQRAIRAKVKDIVGRKWMITGEGKDTDKARLADFFAGAFGERGFGEGMGDVWTDYEAVGNGYLEVIPNLKAEPAELAHIPAPEMWIRLDGLGFVQQKGGEYSHFRMFGVEAEKYAALPESDQLAAQHQRTSVIHFSRYFPWSPYYGIPSIMPAWSCLALMTLVAEYNLQFFANNAIPDYAIILEGEWGDDAEDVIREYFRTHLKGQSHKTLTMRAPGGGKVTFQQLTSTSAREGSFRLLRTDSRDEILHAHGVPPQKVGIVETGKLGGNLASEQIEEYKASIVEPGQQKVATRLTRVIQVGFGVAGLAFEFEAYDTDDRKRNAEIDEIYLRNKVIVPNEVRSDRFPEREPLEGGDEPLGSATLGELAAVDEALQGVQREVREAIAK
jgi:PBSX family phage portal protein